MKRMKSMRVAAVLFALVLITSTFAGNTFAKYVVKGEGEATARVAKFGVAVTADENDFFKKSYKTDDDSLYDGEFSVSNADDNLVAPGTSGNAISFTISGTPEVAVDVAVSFEDASDVFLLKGDYTDDTTADPTDDYSLADDYYPVVFTLTKNGTKEVEGTLQDVVDYFQDATTGLNGQYDPGDDLEDVFGLFEISWAWAFEEQDDIADTILGNLAAGITVDGYAGAAPVEPANEGDPYTYEAIDTDNYNLDLGFKFSVSVTQID